MYDFENKRISSTNYKPIYWALKLYKLTVAHIENKLNVHQKVLLFDLNGYLTSF